MLNKNKLILSFFTIAIALVLNINAKETIIDSGVKNTISSKKEVKEKLSLQNEVNIDLKRYGINYFQKKSKVDLTKIITPNDYILNTGDSIDIKIFGLTNKELKFNIDKEGNAVIPIYGPLRLVGLKFKKAKKLLGDVMLQIYPNSNSTIHISKYASITVSISGQIKSPGVYNLSPFSTLVDLVIQANGINKMASLRKIYITRDGKKHSIDLYKVINGQISFQKLILKNNDFVYISTASKLIYLDGAVKVKGIYELTKKENLNALLQYAKGLMPQANKNSITLKRYVENKSVKIIPININKKQNLKLFDGDYLLVDVLSFTDISKISIFGEVNNPGEYKVSIQNNSLKKIIEKTGGLTEIANKDRILITRTQIVNNEKILKRLFVKYEDDVTLNPFDKIQIFKIKNWDNQIKVTIKGCVEYPSTYILKKGEKIDKLLDLAGGYSQNANFEGAYLERESLKDIQEESINENIRRLQSYIVTQSTLNISNSNEEMKLSLLNLKKDLELLKESKKNLTAAIALKLQRDYTNTTNDIVLKNNDTVVVPMYSNTVQIVGEVMYPSTFVYITGKTYSHYIKNSGGFTHNADIKKAYVKRVNKMAVLLSEDTLIKAGDTIVIPTMITLKANK